MLIWVAFIFSYHYVKSKRNITTAFTALSGCPMGLLNLVRNAAGASPKPSSFWYKRTKNVKKMFHMTAGIWEHSAPCRIRSCDRECFCGKRNLCENSPPTHLKPDQEENTSVKQCSVLLQTEQGSLFADGLTTQLWTKLWNVSVLDCSLIFCRDVSLFL